MEYNLLHEWNISIPDYPTCPTNANNNQCRDQDGIWIKPLSFNTEYKDNKDNIFILKPSKQPPIIKKSTLQKETNKDDTEFKDDAFYSLISKRDCLSPRKRAGVRRFRKKAPDNIINKPQGESVYDLLRPNNTNDNTKLKQKNSIRTHKKIITSQKASLSPYDLDNIKEYNINAKEELKRTRDRTVGSKAIDNSTKMAEVLLTLDPSSGLKRRFPMQPPWDASFVQKYLSSSSSNIQDDNLQHNDIQLRTQHNEIGEPPIVSNGNDTQNIRRIESDSHITYSDIMKVSRELNDDKLDDKDANGILLQSRKSKEEQERRKEIEEWKNILRAKQSMENKEKNKSIEEHQRKVSERQEYEAKKEKIRQQRKKEREEFLKTASQRVTEEQPHIWHDIIPKTRSPLRHRQVSTWVEEIKRRQSRNNISIPDTKYNPNDEKYNHVYSISKYIMDKNERQAEHNYSRSLKKKLVDEMKYKDTSLLIV